MNPIMKTLLTKKPEEWILVEFNGFRCTGIRVTVLGHDVSIHQKAVSIEAQVDQALATVIRELRPTDSKQTTKAILLTSQAAASIVTLPINPSVPSKREQLQALVEWEFEQILSEHGAALSLETILAGRDCLSEDEIDDVRLAIGEQKATSSCISIAPKKFGEQAIRMGYVSPEEVESGLTQLEQFTPPDDRPHCSFFPITTNESPLGSEGFPWLVCGIGKAIQSQWIHRFAALDLRLERIYPLGFTAAAALSDSSEISRKGLISLLEGADCYTSYAKSQLKALRWGPAPLSPRNPEALCALVADDSLDELWLSGRASVVDKVIPVVNQSTRYQTHPYPKTFPDEVESGQHSSEHLVNLIGAIRHQIGASALQTPWIEGAPPLPPWWQQSSKWWGIMGIIIACLVLVSELALGFQRHSVTLATKEIRKQTESAQGEIAKVTEEASTASQLIEQRDKLLETIEVTSQAANLIEIGLELRSKYIVALFSQLAGSVSPAIAINEFQELPDHSIHVSGWALTETDAQEFIHKLATRMEPWGLRLAHQEVQTETGRLGLTGYDLDISLRPATNTSKL